MSPDAGPASAYDAVLVVSFGAPEAPADVLPFLENVLRGRNVPRARLEEVAEHYHQFDGRSPLAAATRALVADLERELAAHGPRLPVYLGNRNWHPLLEATLRRMAADGVRHALAFVTSAFGSYSGCRQYLEDLERARAAVGPAAPTADKLRLFYNHPAFLDIWAERLAEAWAVRPQGTRLIFTAHSIPQKMAASGPYQEQLHEACRLLADGCGATHFELAFQSRSGPPQQPWLEPALDETLRRVAAEGAAGVVLVPIGFLSDHMEVVYDLDCEARQLCQALQLGFTRIKTPGDHPRFAGLIRELILERLEPERPRLTRGPRPAWPDLCPEGCCAFTPGRPAA